MGNVQVIIRPEAREWTEILRSRPRPNERALEFRRELGRPTAQMLIFSGHQPQLWHPGILAKLMAQRTAARSADRRLLTTHAWVVADQDEVNPWVIRYPVRRADGRLEVRTWRADGPTPAEYEHVPAMNRPAINPALLPELGSEESFGAPGVGEGLRRIRRAIVRHRVDAPEWSAISNTARQAAYAAQELLPETDEPHMVMATQIAGTRLFAGLVETMRNDPDRMMKTYNTAVRAHDGARVAELQEGELPLWHIPRKAGAPRQRLFVKQLEMAPREELAPRALLMTGMLRWAGCELFVHGTGGGGDDGQSGYDAITTEWFREWLGANLAPTATVTANVRLTFGEKEIVTPEQIARARWLAHAAKHRPALLHDAEGESASGPAVATLVKLKNRRDPESRRVKREAFRTLHTTLDGVRARHAGELERLGAEAAAAAARREEAEIIADRTWAFPLYEDSQLEGLRVAIEEQFGM